LLGAQASLPAERKARKLYCRYTPQSLLHIFAPKRRSAGKDARAPSQKFDFVLIQIKQAEQFLLFFQKRNFY
jgi:hypothetical protein